MSLAILGLGTALPATRVTTGEALKVCKTLCCRTEEQATWLPDLYANSGIDTRHMAIGRDVLLDLVNGTTSSQSPFLPSVSPDGGPRTSQRMQHYAEQAAPLALQAARKAVDRARLAPADITHLITVSCTGFEAPGVDIGLIKGLALAPTVERTHVGFMGCHGALNGLRVARAITGSDPDARILLCAVELCSLHYHYHWNPQKLIANALFADGAAAVVGVPASGGRKPPDDSWQVTATGSCVFPGSEDAMTWTIGDNGFEMTLSKHVPRLIAAHLRPWMESWLVKNGTSLSRIASWAIHPGGPRILDAVAESLGLGRDATATSRAVLRDCGNMSSPTILFILDRLRRSQAPRPCVALAFGPGLTAEAVLFQ